MSHFIIRRALLVIPTAFLVSIICFLSVRFIPGSVIDMMVAQMAATSGNSKLTTQEVKHSLGMDVPLLVQYERWISKAVRGDLGNSLWTNSSIGKQISERLPVSAELGIIGIIVALVIALPIGMYSAIRQDTALDYLGRTISVLFMSIPIFWIGTAVVVYPSILWGWAPPLRYIPFTQNPIGNILQFLLPGFILGMGLSGMIMRLARTTMLEVLRQDYVRTAWAKGLKERVVVMRHVLRNSLLPVVTILGIMVGTLVGGEVVLEQIFGLPGIGVLFLSGLSTRDYPLISGVNLLLCIFILVVNLFIDLIYSYLDPRIKLS